MTPQLAKIADQLGHDLGWPDAPWTTVAVNPSPTALATSLPIADLAVLAQSAVGLTAASVHQLRTGTAQRVLVDRRRASLSMTEASYLTVDGRPAVEWDPLTGYFRALDGWVYLHTAFTHLREGLLVEFDLPNDRQAVEAALARLPARQIEDRAAARGVCAIMMRDRATWAAHPQSVALRAQPLIALTRYGNIKARDLAAGQRPLSGLRVLDLSRVIAGPMIGRTLAEHGADVLRISAPHLPSIAPLIISTGFGKRSAHVDLETADGRSALTSLIAQADVLIDGYRPGALARHGLDFESLVEMNPSIVYLTLSAFGETGPWAGRRGYDTYVQAATGLSSMTPTGPQRLPCQPLDYLTGYLGAASIMAAVGHRISTGGAWRSELSLARIAEWIWACSDRLPAEPEPPEQNVARDAVMDLMTVVPSTFGQISALAPLPRLDLTPSVWSSPPVPLGTHKAQWLT